MVCWCLVLVIRGYLPVLVGLDVESFLRCTLKLHGCLLVQSVYQFKKKKKEKENLCNLFNRSDASVMKWLLLLLYVFHATQLILSSTKLSKLFTLCVL